ncbi:YdbL family protein [Arenimonas caeni]|uniref:YdbL family protein n=2 Tax=Arenimonas caeni TaxID=2058085 RepID=UPI001F06DB4F|nr:YdbL family protein [Arenimonas caeni]MDY0022164.1 YdbL family protein [Arenimonas caeni]
MGMNLKRLLVAPALALAVFALGACVTINVYFPAAEAQQAAEEFVEKVLGEEGEAAPAGGDPQALRAPVRAGFNPLSLLIGEAHAQEADITIRTPAIQAIQDRMAARFQSGLQAHFDSGAVGFGKDGLVVLRDPSKVALKDRVSVNQLVADENRDRNAVYREIAVANNHPEWETQIRETFARQWVASARKGWWYQASDGAWKQK